MIGSNKGFTLIELVTFVVIGAFIVPASIVAFATVMDRAWTPDYRLKARFYAEQKMETLISTSYPYVSSGSDEPASGLQRTWEVCYVSESSPGVCPDPQTETNYKKIKVTITMSLLPLDEDPATRTYIVETIVTKRPKS